MDENQVPSNNMQDTSPEATVFFSTGELMEKITGELRSDPQIDPLDAATELPALFPQEAKKDVPQPPSEQATVVSRPKKKKRRIVWPILRCLGKLLLGLVLAAIVLAAGLVGYLTVTEFTPAYAEIPLRGPNSVDEKVSDSSLRLVSFNTGYGSLGEDADFFMDGGVGVNPDSQETVEGNMIGIERILNRLDADFVLLQEVDTDSSRSFRLNQWLQYEFDLDEKYESRFAYNYSCDFVPYPLDKPMGRIYSGIATFSRYDISSATRYSLPCPFEWPVRAANIKRCMLVTRIPLEKQEERELVIINVHLEAYDDGEGKIAQFRQVLDFMEAEYAKGNYVIAGGDFNQTFPEAVDTFPIKNEELWMPGLLEELPQSWQYAYDDSTPTCRLLNQPYDPKSEATQYYVIDGFILSPNVTLDRVETLDEDFLYSDHNPVVLDITLE